MGYYHVRGAGMAEMGSLDHVCSRHSFDKRYLDDDDGGELLQHARAVVR